MQGESLAYFNVKSNFILIYSHKIRIEVGINEKTK